MEVTRTVCSLKTVLNQLEKSLECDFKNIVGKSREYTQLVDDIVSDSRLQPFFLHKGDDELRKLHFLLLLNTDLKITSALESDCCVGHVVGVIPRLSHRLYFAITRRYNLLKYANEILEFGPVALAVELLEIVLDEEKHLSDRDRFEILGTALQSVGVRITKTDCEFTLKRIAEFFRMLMLCYNKRSNDEEDTKKSNEQMANEGYKFASIISLLYEMTSVVYSGVRAREYTSLYNLEIPYDATNDCIKSELKSKCDTVRECYESVFFKCRELMEQLDLDMFLTWYEVKVNKTNLQSFIGQKVFYLCCLLEEKRKENQLPASVEELTSMLRSISVKPAVVDETVCDTSAGQLEELIANNTTFDEQFFEHVERFLEDDASFKPDISKALVRRLFDAETRPHIDLERIKRIIVRVIRDLDTVDLTILLAEFISEYGPNHFMIEKENDFSSPIRQLCALCLADDVDSEEHEETFMKDKEQRILNSVALMAFHATSADLKLIIREGCSERNDVSVIVKVLKKLEPLCLYKLKLGERSHSVLVEAFKQFLDHDYKALTIDEKDHFTRLVIALSSHKLLHSDDFLSVGLLPLLYAEEDSNWSLLADFLLLFKSFFEKVHHESKLCLPILFVQMARILEDSRWSMTTFSSGRILVCERAIDAIQSLMEHPKEISIPIHQWMQDQLKTHSYLTLSHFMGIYRPPSSSSIDGQIATFLCESPESYGGFTSEYSKNKNGYVVKMGHLILRCTQGEFRRIIRNYAQGDCHRTRFMFDWMSDSITFISNVVRCYSFMNVELIQVVYNCLGYLINNFLSALQKMEVFPEEVDYIKYINRVIAVVRIFPENLIGPYQFNIIKFLVEELSKPKETTFNFDDKVRQLLVGLYLL